MTSSCWDNDKIDIYRQNLANNSSVPKFQEKLNMIEYYDENTDINEIVYDPLFLRAFSKRKCNTSDLHKPSGRAWNDDERGHVKYFLPCERQIYSLSMWCQKIFNDLITSVANDIGFDGLIPPDYYTDDEFSSIIKRHCSHLSITKIKQNNAHNDMCHFQCINHYDVVKIINDFASKKAHGYGRMPMKMLQVSTNILLQLLQIW